MTYIENIFVCITAPLLVAAFCLGRKHLRFFLFTFAGMGACLLSAYVNTFFAALYEAPVFNATAEIAPMVEEVMKFLPLLFYLLVFDPKRTESAPPSWSWHPVLPPLKTSATWHSTERSI